ncbi:MAG: nucleoside triphosphate pyrophosphohydrolase [Coriobacteriales bacterium]|nr:nucleoside triphosphate pyrophosphohydrolase [Coriobacteriales bacterium]
MDRKTALRNYSPETHPSFDRLVRTIWRLRQPDGCPWDRAQTHKSISKNMIEEAYEAVEAIAQDDTEHMIEELGDVLEQVLLHAQIGFDEGTFNIDDICSDLNQKLVRRHPHVFGSVGTEAPLQTADEALDVWDNVKREERSEAAGEESVRGLLDSVPLSLPALMQAQKISKRAAKAGFEWDTVADIWNKVEEERAEFLREEPGTSEAAEEFGDLLFALVNVARRSGIDAEEALAASNRKFRRRWAAMEARANLDELDTAGLNDLWDEVKGAE